MRQVPNRFQKKLSKVGEVQFWGPLLQLTRIKLLKLKMIAVVLKVTFKKVGPKLQTQKQNGERINKGLRQSAIKGERWLIAKENYDRKNYLTNARAMLSGL